ncbi:MAG: hypothetical protein RLZZ161_1038 [Bacteroidota bacterium]
MEEYFLHFLWQYGLFDTQNLITTDGLLIRPDFRGTHNLNSGPDFSEARIRVGNIDWVGQVEIHVNASDWLKHNHQNDKAYDNVILHVVLHHDIDVFRTDGSLIPCLEMRNRIPAGYLHTWKSLSHSLASIPCKAHNPNTHTAAVLSMKHRVLAERVWQKAGRVLSMGHATQFHWEEMLYKLMARYLGRLVNGDAMESLTNAVPFALIQRYRHNAMQMQALLFGQSGLLTSTHKDDYAKQLYAEYRFLKNKHALLPLTASVWKFGRLRPPNFPTLRIAQLSAVLEQSGIFSVMMEAQSVAELKSLLCQKPHAYWETHYRFDYACAPRSAAAGNDTMEGLIINAVLPLRFAYAQYHNDAELQEKALDMLSSLPPESNKITRNWQELGFENNSAYDSQSLLGLQQLYCEKRRCLECSIGQKIMRNEEKFPARE